MIDLYLYRIRIGSFNAGGGAARGRGNFLIFNRNFNFPWKLWGADLNLDYPVTNEFLTYSSPQHTILYYLYFLEKESFS